MENVLDKVNRDRTFFNTLGNFYPVNSDVEIANEVIQGVNCYWFTPDHAKENKIIVYLHGGMYGLGSIHSHKSMVSHYAASLSVKIVFVEYALAPEKPFPNGVNDVFNVYQEIIHRFPKAEISVIGDSAGGGLVVSLIKKLQDQKGPIPSHAVLISPWIYLKCNTPSYETRERLDPILKKERLLEYANYYVGDNWEQADPGQLGFKKFPPTLILVGTNEILFDDSKLFYDKIHSLQPNTKLIEFENQTHVWPIADINSDAAKKAIREMKDFLTNQ